MKDIAKYVTRYVYCQKAKLDRYLKQTKLILIMTEEELWEEIVMGFIGDLPDRDIYNTILVIIDCFTKM